MLQITKSESILAIMIIFLAGLSLGAFTALNTQPKVDLPEEWQEITVDTSIKGFITPDATLHIEFDYTEPDIKPEYVIEVLDSDIVLMMNEEGDMSTVDFDSIPQAIERDNL